MEPSSFSPNCRSQSACRSRRSRPAEADREAVVATFLKTIEDYADEGAEAASEPSPLFVIFHLLGGWREKAAYRPLVRLLRCSPDALDNALGDALTESAHVVMAAVFDGDPEPLYELILDAKADKFARSGMFDALVILAVNGDLPRAEVERFLRLCPSRLEPAHGVVWEGWQGAVAMLGLEDLRPIAKEAFDSGAVPPDMTEYEYFEHDLRYALAHPEAPHERWDDRFALWDDTIAELSQWYRWSERDDIEDAPWEEASSEGRSAFAALYPSEPMLNPNRGVGRNDPCPCGSGKKYKKCCLN